MDVDYMELRKGAITEAKKTTPTGRLGMTDLTVAKLMDPIRKVDWSLDSEGKPVIRPVEITAHTSAVLLQERGTKPKSACDLCVKTKNKPFQSCVCAPPFRRFALRLKACANCVWHGREAHCSLRTDFVANGDKPWMWTLDSTILHLGGLLYTEGLGRRLKGLPVPPPKPKILVPAVFTARKPVSSKPASATDRQPPRAESKAKSRPVDKSSPAARRLAGNDTSSSSTSASVLGKRSAPAASSSSIEPPTKRTCRSKDGDGELVPWPCTSIHWNDSDALKTIYSDLQRHMRAVKRRIEELEDDSLETRRTEGVRRRKVDQG